MSDKIDQFCDKLKEQLNAVEARLQSVKASLQALPKKSEQAVRVSLDEVQAKFHTEKDRLKQTQANLSARAEHKIAETKEAISEWKAKRETRKLTQRADRTEAYAVDALENGQAAIGYAEEAILEAAVARIDANATQSTTAVLV